MIDARKEASEWRIGLAQEASRLYAALEGVEMIVLGGSPSRGLSDAWSDLDIVVYWDARESIRLEPQPLGQAGLERRMLRKTSEDGTFLESYYLGGLKLDFGHLPLGLWERWVGDAVERFETAGWLHKSIAGFLDSIPLHNPGLAEEWKRRASVYPDKLARKMVAGNLGFFQRGVLDHQGLERGDVLYFYDGLCVMMKKILGILAGLNRIYFSADEPRWIEYELGRMRIKPRDAWARMKSALEGDRTRAAGIVEDLVAETLELIAAHMPDLDVSRLRKLYPMPITACESRPAFPAK